MEVLPWGGAREWRSKPPGIKKEAMEKERGPEGSQRREDGEEE